MAGSTYKVQLTFTNTQNGESETLTFQLDPTTFNAAKWDGAFNAAKAALDKVIARSSDANNPNKEPPVW
jgi:hypothetical protein